MSYGEIYNICRSACIVTDNWFGYFMGSNKVCISIKRQQKQFSIEETGYEQAKEEIKKSFKEDKT